MFTFVDGSPPSPVNVVRRRDAAASIMREIPGKARVAVAFRRQRRAFPGFWGPKKPGKDRESRENPSCRGGGRYVPLATKRSSQRMS